MTKVVKLTSSDTGYDINRSVVAPWTDAPLIDDPPFTFNSGSDSITVQEDGVYEIRAIIYQFGYSRNNAVGRIRINGSTVDGWGGSAYIRDGDGHNHSSSSPHTIANLSAGDEVDIYMWREADGHNGYMREGNVFFMIKYPEAVVSSGAAIRGSESGDISPGNKGVVALKKVSNEEQIKINAASLIRPDGQPVPSDVNLILATMDNNGKALKRKTVLTGDGNTPHDYMTGNPVEQWTNTTGSDLTVAALIENNTASTETVFGSVDGTIGGI